MTTAETLLAQLHQLLAQADAFGMSAQTKSLLNAVRTSLNGHTNAADPLAYRAAVENVAATMRTAFGAAATERAEDLAQRSPHPFARMVRNELGREDRITARDRTDDAPADLRRNGDGQ